MKVHLKMKTVVASPRAIRLALIGLVLVCTNPAGAEAAAATNVGPKACQDCHKTEDRIWAATRHATSFLEIHKSPRAKDILAAAGGDKNMRKNTTCVQCHFTLEKGKSDGPSLAKSAVSCESCHGAASEWVTIHNDYGGPGVQRTAENPGHKAKRIEDARNAGMVRPEMKYEQALKCASCHGLADPDVAGATLEKMLAAGHPVDPDFDLVRYSQGTIRHRFFPPHDSVNAEMSVPELARLFVAGHSVKLVSASRAAAQASNPAYKEVQQKRIANATTAIAALKSVPEAAALIAQPTEENARKLIAAIQDKDLSGEIAGLLPAKTTYK